MDSPTGAQSLEVRRIISATPARVYDAWTTPELLMKWFAPANEYTVIVHRADTHVGGTYRIEMRHANGASHIVVGEYRELNRPTRLAFTWGWEGAPVADTLVTVEFHPSGAGTEVVLTHTRFPTESARNEHLKGWTGCLDRLTTTLTAN
jgi:uncharacterized protein YndB with AHSA1/START domain